MSPSQEHSVQLSDRGVYYVLGKINVLNLRFISVLKKWTSGQRTRKVLYISKIFPLKQQNIA